MGRKTHGPYLLAAIEHNDIKKINEILNSQIRNKAKVKDFLVSDVRRLASEFSEVPLLLAACNDDPTIIKYFVTKHGADINHVHEDGFGRKKKRKTALTEAVRRGLYATVDTILSLNADANENDHKGRTALHHAVRKADFRMVKMLCTRGAQVNVTDKASNTPLHMATIFGHMELVKVLIKYGGDLYKKGQHGAIPIHIAAREGHSSLVRLFCQYEVSVNIKVPCYEGQERAPIHVAAEEGHAETVFSLLDSCGADCAMRDSEGESPLHCCVIREYDPLGMKSKEDYTETVKVLLNFGASVNVQNRRGETPMHLAARNEFQKIVEVLVLAGGDPLIEDFDSNKPMDLVFPDDTVTRQILKNAQEERERYMSEAIEIRAKGFTTSILKPLPLSMRSQSTMNMLQSYVGGTMNSSMSRAASVPGFLNNNPVAMYEDGYLAPRTVRGNNGPGHAYSQTNTYKSSNSRSTGSSSGSHIVQQPNPQPSQAPTYAHLDERPQQPYRNEAPTRRQSETAQQPQKPPMINQHQRAQSVETLNSTDSPYHERSLPSPPPQRKVLEVAQPSPAKGVRDSVTSQATSFWSVSTQDHLAPVPVKQAGIKPRGAPLKFVPVGPHGLPEQIDHSDEDSYFDDESFETLDTLSDGEHGRPQAQRVLEANRKHQEVYEQHNKSGGQGNLDEWLVEQVEYNKDRGPVAQSTPPQSRGRPAANGTHPPVPPKPVPRDRKKSTDVLGGRRAQPPLLPKHGDRDIQQVIELGVDGTQRGHSQTIIKITSTPTEGLSDAENPASDGDAPKLPPRKGEKPKVGKKPKLVAENDGSENTKSGKKKKKKKGTKKKPLPAVPHANVDLEGNEIYEDIMDSDLSAESVDPFQPHASSPSAETRKRGVKPTPQQRGRAAEEEARPAKKQSASQQRQEMFQEDMLIDKERQEQLNREKELSQLRQQQVQQQQREEQLQRERELHEQQMREQQEELREQQRQHEEQQRQAEMHRRLHQQQSVEESPKRKVTIGSQEVHHLKSSPDDGCRIIVYSFDGSVKFKLVGGNKEGIYVSDVEPNSEPALNGLLVGDQIVKINGRSVKGRTKEEVYGQLVNSGTKVSLVVRERRNKCVEILEKGGEGDLMYMEAFFDHDPSQTGELIVRKGDIFSIRDTLPEGSPGSWKAIKVKGMTAEEESAWKSLRAAPKEEDHFGFIPNIQRSKQIMTKENLLSNKPTQRGNLFTRSFGRSKTADRQNKHKDAEKRSVAEAHVTPYKRVTEQGYEFRRPVVLLGLFCDIVRQQLLQDSPDFFASPEGDIEVPTNMGPVDLAAIQYFMDRGKHAVIIMSPKGISYIKQHTDFAPVVVYLNPVSKNVIKVVKNRLAPDYDKKVNFMFDEAMKFEKQHAALFTTEVQYTTDDSWLVALKNSIFYEQDITFWRPYSPDDDSSDEEVESEDEGVVQMRGRQHAAASRVAKTTDDLPDPHLNHSLQRMPTQQEQSEDDDFDSDESDEEVGIQRPGFQAVDPEHAQYAQPHANREAMRARNRSEGDILQYLNNDINNPAQPHHAATYNTQPAPPQNMQHHQYRQAYPQQQRMPRQAGPPGPRGPGAHPGYEFMRQPMNIQRAPFQPPMQRPPMNQQRPRAPANAKNNRETQL